MHMADALISPTVGVSMWVTSASLIFYSSRKIQAQADDRKVPLMGVLGAFIFAAQMINFSIPATGSSGHISGGMILSILLGPYAAFLVMASVLIVQAFMFGDGGLLALGCNIMNLGFFPCFIAYPLIYRMIVRNQPNQTKILTGSLLASIVGLQLGAWGVVMQTILSGVSDLPFHTFFLLMQSIHLAIGVVEGIVTAAVVMFVYHARPELLSMTLGHVGRAKSSIRDIIPAVLLITLMVAGVCTWFASKNPDGLEWAIAKASVHASSFAATSALTDERTTAVWPNVDYGVSAAGVVGSGVTLGVIVLLAWVWQRRKVKI